MRGNIQESPRWSGGGDAPECSLPGRAAKYGDRSGLFERKGLPVYRIWMTTEFFQIVVMSIPVTERLKRSVRKAVHYGPGL